MADRGGVLDYDANGNHVLESVTASGVTLTTRTVYDAMGRAVRVTGPRRASHRLRARCPRAGGSYGRRRRGGENRVGIGQPGEPLRGSVIFRA